MSHTQTDSTAIRWLYDYDFWPFNLKPIREFQVHCYGNLHAVNFLLLYVAGKWRNYKFPSHLQKLQNMVIAPHNERTSRESNFNRIKC